MSAAPRLGLRLEASRLSTAGRRSHVTPQPELRELAAQHAAIERAVTDAAGMTATIDRAFPALFGQLAKLGVTPSGPPFIRYLKTGERWEIELGVPVPASVRELDGAELTSLPAGRSAVLRYIGRYEGLRDACGRLRSWVVERGEGASGPRWEVYVTDPRTEPDASKRITDTYQPLR
jgi:effector-binding domain-containing protein